MSALGHKQTYAVQQAMSAFPPIATAKADIKNDYDRSGEQCGGAWQDHPDFGELARLCIDLN
jgi:hypothetical protein